MLQNYIYHASVENSEELNKKLLEIFDKMPASDNYYNLGVTKFDGHNHPDTDRLPLKWKWFDVQCLPGMMDDDGNINQDLYNRYTARYVDIPEHCEYKGFFLDSIENDLNKFAAGQIKKELTDLDFRMDIKAMWFHQMFQNDYMDWDNHFYAQWACVYYVELPDPSMATEFIHPDTEQEFQPVNAKAGDLVIFPSFLLHRSPFITDTRRKTVIAWNMDIACLYDPSYFDKLAETHPNNWDKKLNNF